VRWKRSEFDPWRDQALVGRLPRLRTLCEVEPAAQHEIDARDRKGEDEREHRARMHALAGRGAEQQRFERRQRIGEAAPGVGPELEEVRPRPFARAANERFGRLKKPAQNRGQAFEHDAYSPTRWADAVL